jgi:hypothetical protein
MTGMEQSHMTDLYRQYLLGDPILAGAMAAYIIALVVVGLYAVITRKGSRVPVAERMPCGIVLHADSQPLVTSLRIAHMRICTECRKQTLKDWKELRAESLTEMSPDEIRVVLDKVKAASQEEEDRARRRWGNKPYHCDSCTPYSERPIVSDRQA